MKHNIRQRIISPCGLPGLKVKTFSGELGSGVEDINRQEIFEGDKVIFGERDLSGVVVFKDGMFQILYHSDDGKELYSVLGLNRGFVDVEVVGHIAGLATGNGTQK